MSAGIWSPSGLATPGTKLYHGTALSSVCSILRDGLIPQSPEATLLGLPVNEDQPVAVYLTEGKAQARACAWRKADVGAVLTVDMSSLPVLWLGFVTCMERIPPERILNIRIVRVGN